MHEVSPIGTQGRSDRGGMGGYIPPNIFGSVGNFLFHSVKIAAVGKSRKS